MDIRQMKYFKTIVEEGTISKAAQVLHMAQPPLSIQLKQLEEELGITLLKRGNKQIELTDAGMRFYKRCLQILDLTEITKNELKESSQDVLSILLNTMIMFNIVFMKVLLMKYLIYYCLIILI